MLPLRAINCIELPGYENLYGEDDRHAVAGLLDTAHTFPWHPIEFGKEQEFDVVIFRNGRIDGHIGLVTGKNQFLNIMAGQTSHLRRIDDRLLISKLSGIYRHDKLMGGVNG
jgi:hypothetical protein